MSDKVGPHHLNRRAILYVRQSTLQQLQHNEESRRLQYAMKDRLADLGWHHVEIIDEDLGKSASGTVERSGFQRLVSEVSLGKVGAIAARELSRFARNNADWQKLMEVCRYVDTLLVDHDAVYDTRKSNDRLLLGLKGNLNEYELDLLRLRAFEARMEKARRGDYYANIAVGFRKTQDGGIEKHPDARVQHTVSLIFDKMLELGSARQVLLWMRENRLDVPVNRSNRGDVLWKPATYTCIYRILTHPIYAGSYAYGRTTRTVTMNDDGSIRRSVLRKNPEDVTVLLHERHDGYVDRSAFERIQTMIASNSQRRRGPGPGAARVGPALLAGLLRCRRCGNKLFAKNGGFTRFRVHRYECNRASSERGEPRCISFSGLDVDTRVTELILRVLEPAAIEISASLAGEQASERNAALEALRLELRAARYAADRAERQYDAVDPDNRLVADELERRWNAALERVRAIEARLDEETRTATPGAAVDLARFESLGARVAGIWHAPKSDVRLKKRIIRTLVEEIVVDTTEHEVLVVVHWKGGVHTEAVVARRRRGQNRAQSSAEIIDAIRLLARVCSDEGIARALSLSEIRTARGNLWTSTLVRAFRSHHEIDVYSSKGGEAWLTLTRAAEVAGVAALTLKRAIARGVVIAVRPVPRGPWILEKADLMRPEVLQRITKRSRPGADDPAAPTSAQQSLVIPRT